MPKRAELSWHETRRGIALESPFWTLEYDLLLGLFNLKAPDYPSFYLRWARARAIYRRGDRRQATGTDDGRQQTWHVSPVENEEGPGLRLTVRSGGSNRRPTLEFSATLFQRSPLLLLGLSLHNTVPRSITVEALQPLDVDPEWGGRLSLGGHLSGLYSAGWQSWTPAGWKPASARDRRTRLGALTGPMHDTPALRRLHPGHLRADLVGVLTSTGENPTLLAGLLSTADQFGSLQTRLKRGWPALTFHCATDGLPLAPEEGLGSEHVALLLAPAGTSPLEVYGEALGRAMDARIEEVAPRGWCSWTALHQQVSERDILRQLDWLAEQRTTLPVEVVQVDDGWQQSVGDWEPNDRFPRGMGWLADRIRQAGFTPGLWLAPLIAQPNSRLAEDHPGWLLQDERGRQVSAGFAWDRLCYGLDVTMVEVQDWLRRLIRTTAQDWGYRYLKLDYLYAAALPACRQQPSFTRAQALRRALEIIRTAAGPETFLLGCGCPLGPAIGLVQAMRIGTDVAPNWRPQRGLLTPLLRGDPAYPSAAGAIRNTLTQAWMHRRLWLNDPDALILRQASSRLTEAEVRSLMTAVALSGGTYMLGDDLPTLEAARQMMARAGLPPHTGRPFAQDLLEVEKPARFILDIRRPWGRGWVAALFNWDDRPADLSMDLTTLGLSADAPCHLHEFWSGTYERVQGEVRFDRVEAHGCRALLLRPMQQAPQWVGSNLHLIQGQEVRKWRSDAEGVTLEIEAGRSLEGYFLLWLPQTMLQSGEGERCTVEAEQVAETLWRIRLNADGARPCRVTIRLRGDRTLLSGQRDR